MRGPLAFLVPRALRQGFNFALMYGAYMLFYLCRKNYAFWLNELVRVEGRAMEEVSVFGSIMEMSYGAGKVVAGPVVDSAPPLLVLSGTLVVSALSNVFMFQSGFAVVDMALWSTNGLVQSAAWPALAYIFMNWFQASPNRAIWYSVLSTNQNVGSALTPVLLTPLVAAYGWKAAVAGPGLLALAYAAMLALFTQESPGDDEQDGRSSPKEEQAASSSSSSSKADAAAKSWSSTLAELVTSPALLSLGVGYAFLTMIRVGMQDWSLMILQETRGVPMEVARDCMVALELGGFVGGVSAGAVSDLLFKSKRGPTMVLFMLLLVPVLAAIAWLPIPDGLSPRLVLTALYFLFGFASFGPHMLVGLTAREVFPKAPATAGAFTKGVAQVGGSFAGYPTSLIVNQYGWVYCVGAWAASAGLGALAFAPLLAVGAFQVPAAAASKKTQ